MKKFLIILGVLLFVGGAVLLAISLTNGAIKNASAGIIHNEKTVEESFNNIKIDVATANVIFEESSDDKCKVLLDEKEKYYHKVEVKNDTLTITSVDEYKFFERLIPSFGTLKVTILLPQDTYNNLDINISTGDVLSLMNLTLNEFRIDGSTGDLTVENMNVSGEMYIDMSTGSINLKNTNCTKLKIDISTGKTNLNHVNANEISLKHSTGKVIFESVRGEKATIDGSTGKTTLTDTIFTGNLYIETSTGDVVFKDSDADTIEIIGETSDITGNLLTGKTFITSTTTGKNRPQSGSTGKECRITTTTGDIIITVGN